MNFDLDFEQPLAELAKEILRLREGDGNPQHQAALQQAMQELQVRTKSIYDHLTAWQTVQVARHKDRPYARDYIQLLFNDFFELHGDHFFGDDHAVIGGPASLDTSTVMLICQQKGRSIQEKQYHNFGMPHPEGYRKAYRLMKQAEKFRFPLICLIDTPGAFPEFRR